MDLSIQQKKKELEKSVFIIQRKTQDKILDSIYWNIRAKSFLTPNRMDWILVISKRSNRLLLREFNKFLKKHMLQTNSVQIHLITKRKNKELNQFFKETFPLRLRAFELFASYRHKISMKNNLVHNISTFLPRVEQKVTLQN